MLLRKDFLFPDEAAVRELVLGKNVEAPDLATMKDFLRFKAATGQGMIMEQTTCNSLNAFAEWFFAGFTRVTDTPTNEEDRSEVYDVDSNVQKPVLGHLKSGRPGLGSTKQFWEILSRGFVAKSRPMQPQSTQTTVVWSTAWGLCWNRARGSLGGSQVRLNLNVRVDDFGQRQ
jgi:hypothetical protein